MNNQVYVIREWDQNFEVSQSKRISAGKPLSWVAMPTKHDGKGLRRLLRSEDALSMFGVWCLLVELGAKMSTRGVFADTDGPFDIEDIADSIGIDPEPIDTFMKLVVGGKINWIELVSWNKTENRPCKLGESSEHAPSEHGERYDYITGQDNTIQPPIGPQGGSDQDLELESIPESTGPKNRSKWSRKQIDAEQIEDYPHFQEWWSLYPNMAGRRKAFDSWVKQGLEFRPVEDLLKVLKYHMRNPNWQDDDGKYIPMGASYLNQKLFDDEISEKNKIARSNSGGGRARFAEG